MKKVFGLAIILIALLLTVQNAKAQKEKALKIGIVDVEMIVKELPEAMDADKTLQQMAQSFKDSLLSIEKIFGAKMEQYNKQKTMMNPEQQKKEEESLQQLQIEYQKYQQEKLGAQGELAQNREKLLAPIREKVRTAIQKVAKKEYMNFVLDKASPMLLYAEDEFDITFSVLDLLKRGMSGDKK
ncbi:MAG: OmpH family outer membrane protein [bacterium]